MNLLPPTCPTMSRIERCPPGGTQSQSWDVTDWRLPSSECQAVPSNASSRRYTQWEMADAFIVPRSPSFFIPLRAAPPRDEKHGSSLSLRHEAGEGKSFATAMYAGSTKVGARFPWAYP